MFSERDKLMNKSLYRSNEKTYFNNDRIEKELAKITTDIPKQAINEAQEEWFYMYKDIKYNKGISELSDVLSPEEIEELCNWLKSFKEPKKTIEEVINDIVEKYGE